MDTWTLDETGNGYADWKNILEYNSYDGNRIKKSENTEEEILK